MVWRRRFLESEPSCLQTLDSLSVFLSTLPSCPPPLKSALSSENCYYIAELATRGERWGARRGPALATALGPCLPQNPVPRRPTLLRQHTRSEPGPASAHPPEAAHKIRTRSRVCPPS